MTSIDEWDFSYRAGGSDTKVRVGYGILAGVGPAILELGPPREIFVLTDGHVADWYLQPLLCGLEEAGHRVQSKIIPPGEQSKSLRVAEQIYDLLGASAFPRDGVIIGLGGGMVTDLAGFVAATWHRGVAHILCPTTLEADIDAAIGGKTAVNHPTGKNLIGAFHQPRMVAVDVQCLQTLPDRDLCAGMAESIKHALITDASFLEWHDQNANEILSKSSAALTELIARNITIKADVVTRDEREQTGLRASLNFGHTIGHAIEASCEYRLRHGECVALGMVAAARISAAKGLLSQGEVDRIVQTIERFHLPTTDADLPPTAELVRRLKSDKKVADGAIRFVLLDGIGRWALHADVPTDMIETAIDSLRTM